MKTKSGICWTASTNNRKTQIIRLLAYGPKGFSDLHRELRSSDKQGRASWSKRTLSIYLTSMLDEDRSIRKVKEKPDGKREVYSLNQDNPTVAKVAKLTTSIDPKLKQQGERDFINSWHNSLDFAFVCLLNDLTALKDADKLEDQIQSDIGDFVELLNIHTNILLGRLDAGALRPFKREKLREIQREWHVKVKKQMLSGRKQNWRLLNES